MKTLRERREAAAVIRRHGITNPAPTPDWSQYSSSAVFRRLAVDACHNPASHSHNLKESGMFWGVIPVKALQLRNSCGPDTHREMLPAPGSSLEPSATLFWPNKQLMSNEKPITNPKPWTLDSGSNQGMGEEAQMKSSCQTLDPAGNQKRRLKEDIL